MTHTTQEKFFELLSKNKINKFLVINKTKVSFTLNDKNSNFKSHLSRYEFEIGDLQLFKTKISFYKELYEINTNFEFKNYKIYTVLNFFYDYVFFLMIIIICCIFLFRKIASRSSVFNIVKSKAKLYYYNNITFKDVAGLEGPKEEIKEIVDFLKSPNKYTKLGGKIPKGALLIGPPGTGKTLLAKAVAGEAQVPFFYLSGSDFVEMFVGVGASRVRDLFYIAKLKSPSIIFIDEIDAIGRARVKNKIPVGNDERENTLNKLLTEMDGFSTKTNVIVLAATNRYDILDDALLRSGRFDRTIFIDLPSLKERKDIMKVHLKKIKFSKSIDLDLISRQIPGFSGADISNICNEAALLAARRNKVKVETKDLIDTIYRRIGGIEKKNILIKKNEKKRIAYHETGHAIISWMIEYAHSVFKITITPRGKSLGAAWYIPEERQITTEDQMKDEICTLLGGRAAEYLIFNNKSTGALNDLERITKQAQSMVKFFGLSSLGNISYFDSTGRNDFYLEKAYSEKTSEIIDKEINKIIKEQYKRALEILKKNYDKLIFLAEKLFKKEVLFKEDFASIKKNIKLNNFIK
uniref:ATP-dependent zinc metalloprotease FtsH n=1 Tax=Candidatus Karelsulcia muelleri TaxID=336810 RepID=UPI00374CD7AA